MSTLYIPLLYMIEKTSPKYDRYLLPGTMINRQWLELPISRTSFHVPKMFESLKFDCMYAI